MSRDVILAGGAGRSLFDRSDIIQDFDLFFTSSMFVDETIKKLLDLNFECTYKCIEGKLYTFKKEDIKIQLICERFYTDDKSLLDSFDINACRFSFEYYLDKLSVFTFHSAIKDVMRKQITLHKVSYPNATFKRMLKYMSKGYSLPNKTINKFNQSNSMIDFTSDIEDTWRFYID